MTPQALAAFAVAIALAQLGLACSRAAATFYGPLAIGWAAALFMLRERRAGIEPPRFGPHAVAGAALALLPVGWMVAGGPYQASYRGVGLVSGLGLLWMATGSLAPGRFRRELVELAVPQLAPFPQGLAARLAPVRLTAAAAAAFLRLAGFSVQREGTFLDIPGASVVVEDVCGGLGTGAQLLALGVVVLCLFRTTALQKALVLLIALVAGFLVNAARVAIFTSLLSSSPGTASDWDGAGPWTPIYPLAATVLACAAWWALLRGSSSSGEPGVTSAGQERHGRR